MKPVKEQTMGRRKMASENSTGYITGYVVSRCWEVGYLLRSGSHTGAVVYSHRGPQYQFNALETKRRLFYLKIQFVPRSKHFSSRL